MAYYRVIVLTWKQDLASDELRAVAQRVRTEMVPMLAAQPGFISYKGFVAQEQPRTSVAVVIWETEEQANTGTEPATRWTMEHAMPYIERREILSGEEMMSS